MLARWDGNHACGRIAHCDCRGRVRRGDDRGIPARGFGGARRADLIGPQLYALDTRVLMLTLLADGLPQAESARKAA